MPRENPGSPKKGIRFGSGAGATFKNKVYVLDGGYIAVVNKRSSKSEKSQVARFSHATRGILGLGFGYLGISRENTPLIEPGDWEQRPWDDYPGPHKLHVFVLVLKDMLVGYMPVRWHWNIYQGGRCLDEHGKQIDFDVPVKVITTGDTQEIEEDRDEEPKRLQGWGIEGIVVLPEYQRRGLGKFIIQKALQYLDTTESEIAFDSPFTDAGKALVRSLGLNVDQIRLTPGL